MKKLKRVSILVVLLFLFTVQAVVAQGAWGNARTLSLAGYYWHIATTEGTWLSSRKYTNSSNWDIHTISKTMWTTPTARLVNSDRQVRSAIMTTPNPGYTIIGTGNTGEIGYNYYAEVRPSPGQVGADTIRLQIRAR